MKWKIGDPQCGDMIRVRAGSVFHYGIYSDDEDVIQFGESPVLRTGRTGEDISVISTDIDKFLCGGFLEVAELDKKEKKKKHTPENTLHAAHSRIGEKGYDILNNNCEHFAYECMFGSRKSIQAETFFKANNFDAHSTVDVYYAIIPEKVKISSVYPKERNAEILSCSNERVKAEKYFVWRLLEYAVKKSLGLKIKKQKFEKLDTGKWICENFCFSLSHSDGIAAVALSAKAVGVDVERIKDSDFKVAKKVFSELEFEVFNKLDEAQRADFFIKKWTQKESTFKKSEEKAFIPHATEDFVGKSKIIEKNGQRYYISVACGSADCVRYFSDIKLK